MLLLAQAAPTLSDPLLFLAGQGVLGVVVVVLWREYRAEKDRHEALTRRIMDDFVPLLTRAADVLARKAERDGDG